MKEHEKQSESGYKRLDTLEEKVSEINAEVMGDQRAGRPSLRQEFINEAKKNRWTMIWLVSGIMIEILIKWGWEIYHHVV